MHQMVNVLFPSPSALSYPIHRDTLSTVSTLLKVGVKNGGAGSEIRGQGERRQLDWGLKAGAGWV